MLLDFAFSFIVNFLKTIFVNLFSLPVIIIIVANTPILFV